MTKATAIPSLLAFAASALALGLWLDRTPDLRLQVATLESQLREAQATIDRLTRERAGAAAAAPKVSMAATLVPGSADAAPHAASSGGGAGTGPAVAQVAAQAGPMGAAVSVANTLVNTSPVKSDKRLAEAEAQYSDLINQFNLQPDEKEAFKALAAKRSDIRSDVTTKLMDPSLTPAQRQAILAQGKYDLGQADASIRQFLNNDADYSTFLNWEGQDLERAQLESGRAIFQNSGAPLDSSQEAWLVDALYGLRKDTKGLGDPYSAETFAGRVIDGNYVQSVLKKFDADSAILLQNARQHLSVPQLESLRALRVQQRVRLENQLWNLSRTSGTVQGQ